MIKIRRGQKVEVNGVQWAARFFGFEIGYAWRAESDGARWAELLIVNEKLEAIDF